MGTLIKSSIAPALNVADRRAQLKALMADIPCLEFSRSVGENTQTGVNNNFDEYLMTYAGNRPLRVVFNGLGSATTDNTNYFRFMKMFATEHDFITSTSMPAVTAPFNFIKCYEHDRGFFIMNANPIDALITNTSLGLIWGTSEAGERWMMQLLNSGTSPTPNCNLYSNILDEVSTSSYSQPFWTTMRSPSTLPITLDGVRTHEILLQHLSPLRIQDGSTLGHKFITPDKMNGFFCFSRDSVAPGVFDIYVDNLTGQKFIMLDSTNMMLIDELPVESITIKEEI